MSATSFALPSSTCNDILPWELCLAMISMFHFDYLKIFLHDDWYQLRRGRSWAALLALTWYWYSKPPCSLSTNISTNMVTWNSYLEGDQIIMMTAKRWERQPWVAMFALPVETRPPFPSQPARQENGVGQWPMILIKVIIHVDMKRKFYFWEIIHTSSRGTEVTNCSLTCLTKW